MKRPVSKLSVATFACAVIVLGVGITACGKSASKSGSPSTDQGLPNLKAELVANTWKLDIAASTPVLKFKGGDVTIVFGADGALSGRGPCNSFMGKITYGTSSISVSDVASTMMACEPDAMAAETKFHAALESIDGASVTSDHQKLTLTGKGGTKLVLDAVKSPTK